MKKSGERYHTLFEISDGMKKAWARKRSTLFYVNLPTLVAIPAFLEFTDMQAKYGEKADFVMGMFTAIDIVFCVKSYVLYYFLQKLVSEVKYDVQEDKIIVTQPHGTGFLKHL